MERLVILVAERPGHREVHASAEDRLALAAAAFTVDDVRLDPYPRTIELLRTEELEDPVFVVGADQLVRFAEWTAPAEILERARVAAGEPLDGLVPPAVAQLIDERGLYRP
jgi:nicotinic acid mononucleotide adenylyltransferase